MICRFGLVIGVILLCDRLRLSACRVSCRFLCRLMLIILSVLMISMVMLLGMWHRVNLFRVRFRFGWFCMMLRVGAVRSLLLPFMGLTLIGRCDRLRRLVCRLL